MCNQSNHGPFHSCQSAVKAQCKSKGSIKLTAIEPRNLGLSSAFASSILLVQLVQVENSRTVCSSTSKSELVKYIGFFLKCSFSQQFCSLSNVVNYDENILTRRRMKIVIMVIMLTMMMMVIMNVGEIQTGPFLIGK